MGDDTQVFEETRAANADEQSEFRESMTDWSEIAKQARVQNPALRKTMRHVYPGAPFGSASDPGFDSCK